MSFIPGTMLMRHVIQLDALAAKTPKARSALERDLEAPFDQLIRPDECR